MKFILTRQLGQTFRVIVIAVLYLCFVTLNTSSVMGQVNTGIIRVASSGSNTSGCGSEAAPCQTIQFAVNQVDQGASGTILVAAGTYTYDSATDICTPPLGTTGVVCIVNKQLTVLGGYSTSDWTTANPATNLTVIDGQNTHRGVFLANTEPQNIVAGLQMEGFTIQNGRATGIPTRPGDDASSAFGGGMFVDSAQTIVLRNMIFEKNEAIGDNTNSTYGGSAGGGGLAVRSAPDNIIATTLESVIFNANKAISGSGVDRAGFAIGGGLYTSQTTVSGRYLTFTNNIAQAGSSTGRGFDNIFNYYADAQGGGAGFQAGSQVEIQYVTATGNEAIGGDTPNGEAGGAYGGALFGEKAEVTVLNADLRNNLALGGTGKNDGGGLAGLSQGGGVSSIDSEVIIRQTTIISNIVRGGTGTGTFQYQGSGVGGGLAFNRAAGNIIIENSIVADNVAEMGGGTDASLGGGGGGLFLAGTDIDADIRHTTFARNQLNVRSMQGQAIALISFGAIPTKANISYSIIAEHRNDFGIVALAVQPGNTVSLTHGLWSDNSKNNNSDGIPTAGGTFNGLETMLSGPANFVSPAAPDYDYHILGTSTAKDQAVNSLATVDIDSEPRPAGEADIGADEYVPIVLTVLPGDGTLQLNWKTNTNLVTDIDDYNIVFSFEAGATPPNEGDSPIQTSDSQTDFTLTGLTNFKRYTINIEARNSADVLIATSNTVSAFPTNVSLYLPILLK